MCGSRGPTDELSHRALPLSLSLRLAFCTYVYVVHRVPTTMRQRQRPGTMLMLNSTDFDDFWPLHVHRALLDNDSRIRNHRYGQGRLGNTREAVALTRALFFPPLRFRNPSGSRPSREGGRSLFNFPLLQLTPRANPTMTPRTRLSV